MLEDLNDENLSNGYFDWIIENKQDPKAHGQKGHIEWKTEALVDENGKILNHIPGEDDN